MTVEPGIYFIPALIEQWEKEKKLSSFIRYSQVKKYLDFGGIRIEDNILVTAKRPPGPRSADPQVGRRNRIPDGGIPQKS